MATKIPAQVVPHPAYFKLYSNLEVYTDSIHPEVNAAGHSRVHALFPQWIMGRLVGSKGRNILDLSRKYDVHVQTWQEGKLFYDNTTHNLPVMWATPMPSFIMFGKPTDIFAMINELCDTVFRALSRNDRRHSRRTYNYTRPVQTESAEDKFERIYRTPVCRESLLDFTETREEIFEMLHTKVSEYIPETATEITQGIINHHNTQSIGEMLSDSNKIVSAISDEQELLENPALTYQELQEINKESDEMTAYGLTADEQREGELFVFENSCAEVGEGFRSFGDIPIEV